MAVYETVIQAVRAWTADVLGLVDPPNEVIPAAEGFEDAGNRPTARPYFVVDFATPGGRIASSETKLVGGEVLVDTQMQGTLRVTGYGMCAYDGLLALVARADELFDPVALTPVSPVQRVAAQFPGEARIERICFVDFDAYYRIQTIPGQGRTAPAALGVDFQYIIHPDPKTFDFEVDF